MRGAKRVAGLVGMMALQIGALAVLVYVVVCGVLTLSRAYGTSGPAPTRDTGGVVPRGSGGNGYAA